MIQATRRGALIRFVGFGTATALASSPLLSLTKTISIPTAPMRLARSIERTLRGGAMLRVERSWQIDFARQGQGIAITGKQLSAEVDAPEALAALAQIEQSRSTDQMWPILLSNEGRILAAGDEVEEDDLAAAISVAEQMISRRALPASERASQQQYLAELQRAGSSLLDQIPSDLFFPTGTPQRAVRTVDLPGGLIGEFEITYDARCAPDRDWLGHAERLVVTRIGANEQRASESWTLSEA